MAARVELERRLVSVLVPYARNSRTHSDAQVAQIAGSIREFGFTNPVLIDEKDSIIAGHGRVLAARKLGMADVPVVVLDHLTDDQKRAYIIADNKLALNAGWDEEMLRAELEALGAADFDLSVIGFDDEELAGLFADKNTGLTDPDAVPEAPESPVSVLGDVWLLGNHRLVCGDSTSADDVSACLNGIKADVRLTDPPYGLGDSVTVKNDYDQHDDSRANLIELIGGFLPLAMASCKRVVLTPGNRNQRLYPEPTWQMAWFVPAGIGRGPWGFCCWQPILCYGKDPKLARGKGSYPDAIVHTERSEKNGHPCPKPINFWAWLVERVSAEHDGVFDPFSGSGTTIIAAEMTGRHCHAIELSPAYVDLAVVRWQNFTGKDATRESDGLTFNEAREDQIDAGIAQERLAEIRDNPSKLVTQAA